MPGGINNGDAAPPSTDTRVSALCDALEICRDKFAEYVELHRRKLHDGTPSVEWLSINEKVERNQEMVRICDAALTKARAAS
jgi:hypothetical protein